MKNIWRRMALLCGLTLLCLTCAGCSLTLGTSPEDLYCLPRLPPEYTELDSCIKAELDGGAEYAAPVSGTNIQPVQLVDLNGDGKEEALAFLRKSTDEKPLKIYIYSPVGQSYEQTTVIEGGGTAIYSVVYSDLDGDGRQELLVGWKVGTELQALTVYALRGDRAEEIAQTNYVKYAVANLENGAEQQLVVLRSDDEGGIADYYTWLHSGGPVGTLTKTSTARLSMTMAELNAGGGRVRAGKLRDDAPALFVTGVSESGTEITDILTPKSGELANVALSSATGVSEEIYHFVSLYPMDIDGDGVTEVPASVSLPTMSPEELELCYRVDWRSYDSDGRGETVLSTYHATEDGWYLKLPQSWMGKIMVNRAATAMDEMTVTFSILGGSEGPQEFLRICTITGENRAIKATRSNRVILSRQAERIYTGELLEANGTWDEGLTEEELQASFQLIATEWLAGDN